MKLLTVAVALTSAAFVAAETFIVAVGEGGRLTFEPNTVTAVEGDTIAFQFKAKNHSVTQSTFADPCTKSGVDSGFFPVAAGATEVPQWSFTVNNASAPLWFYCAQTNHCRQGMVFALNPTAERSFEAFQATANGTAATGTGTTSGTPTPSASATGGDAADANGALSRSSISLGSAGLAAAVGLILGVAL